MGRWGMRLFEGDRDMDLALDVCGGFENDKHELKLFQLVCQTDMLAPQEARAYYKTEDYARELDALVSTTRLQLDKDDLGFRFFEHWRSHKPDEFEGSYRAIVAGALLMRVGAVIRSDQIQYLRDLVPKIACCYRRPFMEFAGFRVPGRAQFLNALNNYSPGVPRDFFAPSCFHCGKSEADTSKVPMKCAKCKRAWYCDQKCQKSQWRLHKPCCIDPKNVFLLNV